jgi:serine/threonine protein kinase
MTSLSDRVVTRLRAVADEPDLSGTRYTLKRVVGRGGMGSVYGVFDAVLERDVALKVLTADVPAERVHAEARVVAQLEHPGIVPVYDTGTLADGRGYYTMKLVRGVHLDAFISETPSLSDRLRLFQMLCDAVAFAHSRGAVHRDLKPANVMVGPFGDVLVMDWGIGVAGTASYSAPEQGEPGRAVGPAADVHALGVILRALVPPGCRPLAAVVDRATAPEPSARYADARALHREITRYLDSESVEAYRESRVERIQRFYRANQPLLMLLLVYIVVRFALFLWRP